MHRRRAEIIALQAINAHVDQQLCIGGGFNTFRHGQHVEMTRDRQKCGSDRAVFGIIGDIAHELAVDF